MRSHYAIAEAIHPLKPFPAAQSDSLIVHFDPQNNRKRQSQEALLKVDGDASVNGPLQIVMDSPPDAGVYLPL